MRPIIPPVPGPEPDPAPEHDPVPDPSKDPEPEEEDDLPEGKSVVRAVSRRADAQNGVTSLNQALSPRKRFSASVSCCHCAISIVPPFVV